MPSSLRMVNMKTIYSQKTQWPMLMITAGLSDHVCNDVTSMPVDKVWIERWIEIIPIIVVGWEGCFWKNFVLHYPNFQCGYYIVFALKKKKHSYSAALFFLKYENVRKKSEDFHCLIFCPHCALNVNHILLNKQISNSLENTGTFLVQEHRYFGHKEICSLQVSQTRLTVLS